VKVITVIVSSLAVLLLAACSDDSGRTTCLRAGDAEVCADRDDGVVTLRATGLKPGSDLEFATEETGTGRYSVGANGEPVGSIGIAGTMLSSPLEVRVDATTATGAVLEGTLVIE
jgi:hypothetical protein